MAQSLPKEAPSTWPAPYDEFDKILVDETWRHGRGDRTARSVSGS